MTPCKLSVDTSGLQRAVPDEGYTSRIVRRFEEFALVVRDESILAPLFQIEFLPVFRI